MTPASVATVAALGGRGRLEFVAAEPAGHVVVIELLVPDQAGPGLALDAAGVGIVQAVLEVAVELVGFVAAFDEWRNRNRQTAGLSGWSVRRVRMVDRAAGGNGECEMSGGLGAGVLRIDGGVIVLDQIFVEAVFEIAGGVGHAEETADVGIVIAEEQFGGDVVGGFIDVPVVAAELVVFDGDGVGFDLRQSLAYGIRVARTKCCETRVAAARAGGLRRGRD